MKTTIKNMLFASLLLAGLSLTSCKGKSGDGDDAASDDNVETTADTTGGMSSPPMGDTIVKKDGDTIIKTGTKNDAKENPTGEQVP